MTFKVRYRGNDGMMREESVEAVNRAECMVECRRRGIAPVSIAEGGSGRHGKSKTSDSPGKKACLVVIVLAIVTALACILYFGRGTTTLPAEKPTKDKITKPQPSQPPQRTPTRNPVHVADGGRTNREPQQVSVTKSEVAAKDNVTTKSPVEDMATLAPTNDSPLSVPSPFKSGTEQVMGWIFMCPVGKMPPMLPAIPQEELARIGEILDSPNLIQEGDSTRTAEMKEMVALAKQELKEFIAQGGKVEDFLSHYHGLLVKAHRARESARIAAESVDRNDPGLSEDFRKKVNEMLSKEGIEALDDK